MCLFWNQILFSGTVFGCTLCTSSDQLLANPKWSCRRSMYWWHTQGVLPPLPCFTLFNRYGNYNWQAYDIMRGRGERGVFYLLLSASLYWTGMEIMTEIMKSIWNYNEKERGIQGFLPPPFCFLSFNRDGNMIDKHIWHCERERYTGGVTSSLLPFFQQVLKLWLTNTHTHTHTHTHIYMILWERVRRGC